MRYIYSASITISTSTGQVLSCLSETTIECQKIGKFRNFDCVDSRLKIINYFLMKLYVIIINLQITFQ